MSTPQRPEEPEPIDCEVCLTQIPLNVATSVEGDEYVVHFFGLACYAQWKAQRQPDASTE